MTPRNYTLHAKSYRVAIAGEDDRTTIEERLGADGSKWAVLRHGSCLNTSGEWEYEPMPSARDDDFLARCRFPTLEAAAEALDRFFEG